MGVRARRRVLFFPDQHLGRNTGVKLGIPQDEMVVWDQRLPTRRHRRTTSNDERARVILWKGYCSVHRASRSSRSRRRARSIPGVNVIVHPECRLEVVQAADSTARPSIIVKVDRGGACRHDLGGRHRDQPRQAGWRASIPDKTIFCLDPVICPCSTMYRIHPAYLAWVLEELVEGRVVNQITVDEETATWAKVALDRMLANKG